MVRFDISYGQEKIENPLIRPLWNDMVECERLFETNDSQFARRTFYRSGFAFIEAQMYWLKDIALNAVIGNYIREGNINVSLASALLDESPTISKTGKLSLEPNRIPFLNYVAFIFRTLAEYIGLDAGAFFSDNSWNELQEAVRVRNRITHPKEPNELNITDEQMDHIRGGLTWVLNCTTDIANRQLEIEEQKNGSSNKDMDGDAG